MNIPFYQTYTSAESAQNVRQLVEHPKELSSKLFTKACEEYFEEQYPDYKALLVNSCTRALELIALSLQFKPEDEIIMPSFNYVGVANAFAQTGAKLVFADIDPLFMNLSVESIKKCLTPNSKAVVVMNYAGVGYKLNEIKEFCAQHELVFVEDNAQGIQAYHEEALLGSYGDLSCISFDSLKNISCGEGGVMLFKQKYADIVKTIFNNGTNRLAFERGEVDAYEWVALGSKFAISEFNAAILLPLLKNSEEIISERREKWNALYNQLWECEELRPYLPRHLLELNHNAHIFYLKLNNEEERNRLMHALRSAGISSSFHYTPLHSSIMGQKQNYEMPEDAFTTEESSRLLRLPIFNDMTTEQIRYITNVMQQALLSRKSIEH